MKRFFLILVSAFIAITTMGQTNNKQLPYYQIPDYPENYTAANVAARMVDGLGFRYYWATEGLRIEDLAFKPSSEARTSEETIDHILGLVEVILNSVKQLPNDGSFTIEGLTFNQKREMTLNKLQQTSNILKSSDANLAEYKIVFKRGDNTTEYPFWNQVNGPIADALWHVGQVISFRRSSGNPYNSKASMLRGKVQN